MKKLISFYSLSVCILGNYTQLLLFLMIRVLFSHKEFKCLQINFDYYINRNDQMKGW